MLWAEFWFEFWILSRCHLNSIPASMEYFFFIIKAVKESEIGFTTTIIKITCERECKNNVYYWILTKIVNSSAISVDVIAFQEQMVGIETSSQKCVDIMCKEVIRLFMTSWVTKYLEL